MGRKASRMPYTGTSFLEGLAGVGRVSSVTGARQETVLVSSELSLTLLQCCSFFLLLTDNHLMMLIMIWVSPHDGKDTEDENTHRWSGGLLART